LNTDPPTARARATTTTKRETEVDTIYRLIEAKGEVERDAAKLRAAIVELINNAQPSHPDCFFVRREDLAAVGRLAFAKPLDQPPTDNGPGALEIGTNERGEVVMNLPRDMTGHIVFSPDEAEHLSTLMARQAVAARESAARQQPPGAGTEGA
jgi:hypothetical protein